MRGNFNDNNTRMRRYENGAIEGLLFVDPVISFIRPEQGNRFYCMRTAKE